ncbi:MAG: pyrroline-5-carboxylate reductase [Tissierella sp.]|uniref:pyrroline-5-carboxylate reductase n=1 Tax=Tissierella sp. TaxID=41274 RepID=UPI003F9DED58
MNKKVGFIGCGNMAKAMIRGIIGSKIVDKKDIIVSANTKETLDKVEEKYGVTTTLENKEVAKKSDYLILAIKPHLYEMILKEIRDDIKEQTIVISIGAGISLDFLKNNLKDGIKSIKTMPNTPALVGEGMTAISLGEHISEEKTEDIINIFKSFGKVEIIDENLMDGFTAICGSSPAYIFVLIEAMADAGVREGIPRQKAYNMAAQSVLGSAKMVLETGEHPGKLKDNVCSPGGTTIEAVISLEESGFRSSIMEAMKVCTDKSKSMKK